MLIDLSHVIDDGMITHKGLPAPHICDYWTREESRQFYDGETTFHIGKIEMVGNTGTYLDAPFHRYVDGKDLSELSLHQLVNLPAILVFVPYYKTKVIDSQVFKDLDVRAKAVIVRTDWSDFWRTENYLHHHPYLTKDAANYLRDAGAVLVGIDSHNIDNTKKLDRPVHTILLKANILIVEHLTNLAEIPLNHYFRFTAVPPKIKNCGTFSVRAFASVH